MAVLTWFRLSLVCILVVILAWWLRESFDPRVLSGKKVLITGASTGIGEELSYKYCKYGAKVVIVARRERELKRVIAKCEKLGANTAHYIVADLSSFEEAKRVQAKTVQLLSGLDILVLNHVKQSYSSMTVDGDPSKIPGDFAVNTFSYFNLAMLFLPQLKQSNGSLIVLSSVAGFMGIAGISSYCASKHALHGFFNSLRQDLVLNGNTGLSITTCIIGPIDTPGKNSYKNHEKMYWYPADQCALAIIKGGALRYRKVYYPYMLVRVSELGYFFFPEFFETITQVFSYHLLPMDGIYRYFRLL